MANDADLVTSIARVQELCEALSRPSTAKGARYLVTFDDGTTLEMKDVLAQGRNALAEVAGFFEAEVPPVCQPVPTTSAGVTHAG